MTTNQTVSFGQTVTGGGGNNFVLDPSTLTQVRSSAPPTAHVSNFSAAHDTIDFSAIVQSAPNSTLAANLAHNDFRVVEDPSQHFATVQVHFGTGVNDWESVVHLDGVNAGDTITAMLNGITLTQIAQINANWHV